MKVYAVSDLHIDYQANADWIWRLSDKTYRNDILIVAGDISHSVSLIEWCFKQLVGRFRSVHYVPGNHDLWVLRDRAGKTSLDKYWEIREVAADCGIWMESRRYDGFSVVPLLGWYDYSFGLPSDEFKTTWMDFRACRWVGDLTPQEVTALFLGMNEGPLEGTDKLVISFSHFLPRIDLMPSYIPQVHQSIYPVLGTKLLDSQIRQANAKVHVYGHSHVNRWLEADGVQYINNAFGYPSEARFTAKSLLVVHDTDDGRCPSQRVRKVV
jgi:predicted phosphodiesterase